MKKILLTNDDGYFSKGLQRLRDYLTDKTKEGNSEEPLYDVYVAAPDRERSAISMSLTINEPMRLHRLGEKVYVIDGTPTDCVNIALQKIMPIQPDFIIAGMNKGENLCEDVFFSGTVAGAFAGHIYGIPSMAVSLIPDKENGAFDYDNGARITGRVLDILLPLKDTSVVYNLNIPAGNTGKIAVTALGRKHYKPTIVERTDPRGRKYYWIGSGEPTSMGEQGTDLEAVANGDISLSVLKYDLNAPAEMKKLSERTEELNGIQI